MIDDHTLILARRHSAEPPADADRERPAGAGAAGEPTRRSPLRFPPRLEISPLTIRRPADSGHERLRVS